MPVGALRSTLHPLLCSSVAALAVLVVLGLAAPAHAAAPASADTASVTTGHVDIQATKQRKARLKKIGLMLRIVRAQKGDPYQYGAAGPNRFDCSGLVYYSSHRAGFRNVPRTSSQQGRFMHRIGRAAMRPGDFVFFTGSSGVYHVGVYVGRSHGRRMIIHAPGSGQRVTTAPIWTDAWFAGTLR